MSNNVPLFDNVARLKPCSLRIKKPVFHTGNKRKTTPVKKLAIEKKKLARLQTSLTQKEFDLLLQKTKDTNLSISEFFRRSALSQLVKTKPILNLEDKTRIAELIKARYALSRISGLLKQSLVYGNQKLIIDLLQKIDKSINDIDHQTLKF